MRRLFALSTILFTISTIVFGQAKDWRQMERRTILDQVEAMQLKNGLNQAASDPKGFKLYALAKDNTITAWQAKDMRGRRLKVTRYEVLLPITGRKTPGRSKLIVICVEAKEVCYEVQVVHLRER